MPIDFGKFTDDIEDYFSRYTARDENDTAKYITNLYVTNILQGTDAPYGNVVVGYNKSALESALSNAFNAGKAFRVINGFTPTFSSIVSTGLIGFWTGGTLAPAVPPPGSISVVTNIVTVPGLPQIINVRNDGSSHRPFASAIVRAFRQHLLTVQGITTALVPAPPGAPVPTPFPWVGYK